MSESTESAQQGRHPEPHHTHEEPTAAADSDEQFFPHSQDLLFQAIKTSLRSSQLAAVLAGGAGFIALVLMILVIQRSEVIERGDSIVKLALLTCTYIMPAMCAYALFREAHKSSLNQLRYFQRELQELELSKIVLREATKSGNRKTLRAAVAKIGSKTGKSVGRRQSPEQLYPSDSASVIRLFNRR